jgi:hypothetical protein
MKQTAVEWLYNNLKSHFEHDGDLLEAVQFSFEQAKDLEMNQIKEAFDDGFENYYDADLYFNKKFKPDYKKES